MGYRIREKLAYSKAGWIVARFVRDVFFPQSRVHWVQQGMADLTIRGLR